MKREITNDLIQMFNERNEKAFRRVFNFYLKPLIFYAFKQTRDLHESQDIVLLMFNKLWHGDFKCQTQGQMDAYLFKAVKNACINYMRSGKVNERRNLEPIDSIEKEPIDAGSVEDMNEFEEKIKRLNEFIDKLPKSCREVIRMQLFGYSGKEISSMLGITSSTVDNQRHRAVIKLKEYFGIKDKTDGTKC